MASIAFMGFSFAVWALLFLIDTVGSLIATGTTAFSALLQFNIVNERQADLFFISFTFPSPNGDWFSSVGDIITWNQWVFDGWALWVRLMIFLPLTAAFIAPMVVALFSAVLTRLGRA